MTTARKIADAFWGYDPCGGQVAINWTALDPSINASSTWWNPTDVYANPQQNADCQVQLNTNQAFDWQMFCTVFVHEFGHLTGHPHVSDSNDVMYPFYVKPITACTQVPDPTAVPIAQARTTPTVATAGTTAHRASAKPRVKHRKHRKHRKHHRHRRHGSTRLRRHSAKTVGH